MKRRGLVLLLLLVWAWMPMRAQFGVSATIPQLAGQTVRLSAYTGLGVRPVDSTMVDASGAFTLAQALPTGMYLLEGGSVALELLSSGKPLQFLMLDSDTPDAVQFVHSPENETWTAYLALRAQYRHQAETLKTVLRQYDPSSAFYQAAKAEYLEVQQRFQAVTDSLAGLRDDYAAKLICADRELPVDLEMTGQEQRAYLMEHFLDAIDFNDLSLIPTNVLTTKMIDYLSLTQGLSGFDDPELAFVVGIDRILEKAKVNMTMYEFALEYMLMGFTAMGMSRVTDYLLNYPQLAEGEISSEEGQRLEQLTLPYQKVKVGAIAPDFEGVTIDGKPYRLHASDARRILVVFWSVDCEYCHEFLVNIRKKLNLDRDYQLVTFALADSQEEVEEALAELKLPGYHFFDPKRWDGEAFLEYHITSTPTVFLLDRNKIIVCKPYDWHELRNFLRNHKRSL